MFLQKNIEIHKTLLLIEIVLTIHYCSTQQQLSHILRCEKTYYVGNIPEIIRKASNLDILCQNYVLLGHLRVKMGTDHENIGDSFRPKKIFDPTYYQECAGKTIIPMDLIFDMVLYLLFFMYYSKFH